MDFENLDDGGVDNTFFEVSLGKIIEIMGSIIPNITGTTRKMEKNEVETGMVLS